MVRAFSVVVLGVLLLIQDSRRPLGAQAPMPRSQLSIDASVLAGGLDYARATRPDRLVGVGAGVGAEFNIRLVRGEAGGKKSTEVAYLELFTRLAPPGRWQYDVGVKAAADVHTADVASESQFGVFVGGYVAPMWGWRHFRLGPRVQAGAYWSSRIPTLGVFITPLTARIVF